MLTRTGVFLMLFLTSSSLPPGTCRYGHLSTGYKYRLLSVSISRARCSASCSSPRRHTPCAIRCLLPPRSALRRPRHRRRQLRTLAAMPRHRRCRPADHPGVVQRLHIPVHQAVAAHRALNASRIATIRRNDMDMVPDVYPGARLNSLLIKK